jgi:hypothetical protein
VNFKTQHNPQERPVTDFYSLLKDTQGLAAALQSIQLNTTDKQRSDLGQLYTTTDGFLTTRDKGNRVRGETVYSCSKIGSYLTAHFGGIGATDSMMWVGLIKQDKAGNEHWVMRPEMRAAVASLGWF